MPASRHALLGQLQPSARLGPALQRVPGSKKDKVSKHETQSFTSTAGALQIISAVQQRSSSDAEASSACASYVQPIPQINLNYFFAIGKQLDREFASNALSSKRGFSGFFWFGLGFSSPFMLLTKKSLPV